MKVYQVMNSIAIIQKDMTLKEAAKIMSREKIGSLVYCNRLKRPKGIITERDLVKNYDSQERSFKEIMSKELITIDLNSTLEKAAELMSKHKIKRLLVTENNQLVGIITATDIIANSDLLNRYSFLFD